MQHYFQELQQSQRVLLLQGPVGPFFKDLATFFIQQGKTVFKINFNGGDNYYYPKSIKNTLDYKGLLENFEDFLIAFVKENQIESVVVFGDCREYHKTAKKVCQQEKRDFFVFEEGYFRPHFVTLEKNGANDYSTLPRNAEFYLKQTPLPLAEIKPLASGFRRMSCKAAQYYIAMSWHKNTYPNYQHHRICSLKEYASHWLNSCLVRVKNYLPEKYFEYQLKQGKFGDFYLFTLQVHNDKQIQTHSHYENVEQYLLEVLDSFIQYAPQNLNLIIKHHPMDRGFKNYRKLITQKVANTLAAKRVFYIFDVNLPALFRQAKAVITLNSTSGLSALIHHLPVKVLGRANYNFAGLTFQGSLQDFWNKPTRPNLRLLKNFRQFHMHKTQLNGSFYREVVLG